MSPGIPLDMLHEVLHRTYLQGRSDALEDCLVRIAGGESVPQGPPDFRPGGHVDGSQPDWMGEWLASCERDGSDAECGSE